MYSTLGCCFIMPQMHLDEGNAVRGLVFERGARIRGRGREVCAMSGDDLGPGVGF